MREDHTDEFELESITDFEMYLAALIEQAEQADMDVRGAWEFQTVGSVRHWEVEIWELDRSRDDLEA